MVTMADFRDRYERAGLQDTVFAKVSGVSRTVLWRVLKGQEPRDDTAERLVAGLAKTAAILCPDDRPVHPGLTLLSQDADLLVAFGITDSELESLATLRLEVAGSVVTLRSKGSALAILLGLRVE